MPAADDASKPLVWLHGEVKTPPRIDDGSVTWRIVYHVDSDAIVILEVFQKKSRTTPKQVIEVTRKRLRAYEPTIREDR